MNKQNALAFDQLFRQACLRCFGRLPETALTETESKLFSNEVLDQTGLVIGWKSIKNYSSYIFQPSHLKVENPSTASLDTLARYVLEAPYTDEPERKSKASHYPYWFQYRENHYRSAGKKIPVPSIGVGLKPMLIVGAIVIMLLIIGLFPWHKSKLEEFADDFHELSDDSLASRGWFLQLKDPVYWNKRSEQPGKLSLFTLQGDNWPDSLHVPGIRNLLLRKIAADCFTAEVHLENFVPAANWQQAGILLLEDTTFSGKSVRLSIAYNDYTGGLPKQRQVLVQAITSLGGRFLKPEETAHTPVFFPDSTKSFLVQNLYSTALRIEKNGKKLRLLYSGGQGGNPAFKEIVSQDFDFNPRYIGLFALKGFVTEPATRT
ncbi:MAG TPA: hypothetical protein VK543_19260, partial [Puia sp.]|nr:hypothetical protein [Puia sp.]